jgi:hypothetical protein
LRTLNEPPSSPIALQKFNPFLRAEFDLGKQSSISDGKRNSIYKHFNVKLKPLFQVLQLDAAKINQFCIKEIL